MASKRTPPPPPEGADDVIKVEPNPTPKEEAKEFESPDERLRDKVHAHELALISAKKGWVGYLTGSTNESLNAGLLILLISLLLLAGSMIGSHLNPAAFSEITDNLFKLVLTVAGYVFGTHKTSKE